MRFGVDFGTTHTTVAYADRGNYPVVSFGNEAGDWIDYIPSLVAWDGAKLVYGFEAEAVALTGGDFLRSIKRLLSDVDVTPNTQVSLGERSYPIMELVSGFLAYVARQVRESSTISPLRENEPLEAVIGIPAHAFSGQRLMTIEAFERGGWQVLSMINEPSAAGFEYTQRYASTINSKRTRVLVYDLGGGTFDASLVSCEGKRHEVIDSYGHNQLGGDDFDSALADLVLAKLGREREQLSSRELNLLLHECRIAKESLNPNSRSVAVEALGKSVSVPVKAFYEAIDELIERTFAAMEPLVHVNARGKFALTTETAGLYVVGGAAHLPAITRALKQRYGYRVHRSSYTAASTAIGLAIAADPDSGYALYDKLSRGVGVFREMRGGQEVSFDPLLGADLSLAPSGDVSLVRTYQAAHNVGHFRFVEYTETDAYGVPVGEVSPAGTVLFPFTRQLQEDRGVDLSKVAVERIDNGPLIEERYVVSSASTVQVTITDLSTGFSITCDLGA